MKTSIIALKLFTISEIISQIEIKHNLLSSRDVWEDTYDYIIVGAGTAGCVVAARLAEDQNIKVLLLETGGPQTADSDVPGLQSKLFGTNLTMRYPLVFQENAFFSRIDGQFIVPRGNVFGGSSSINGMNYYRESPEYFDLWDNLYGIKNWTFNDVLPFFLRSENNLDPLLVEQNESLHTTGGPLSVSTAIPDIMLERFLEAAKTMGYKETFPDGREPFGPTIMQRYIKDGVRQSSSVAFLESDSKQNLHSVGYSHVTKILFDDQKRAIGINFRKNNTEYTVKARKEVIVSAGVFGSPQLLMFSGIGPKEHLQDMNITVISDSRVGDNLVGTISFGIHFDIKNQSEIEKPIDNNENRYKYYMENSGPLAYKASGLQCFSQIPYKNLTNVSNGCILSRTEFISDNLESLVTDLKLKKEWEDYYRPYLGRAMFPVVPNLRRPKSSGTLRLKSNNPSDYPLIDPCILCDKSDIDDFVETTKLALDIYQSPYFQQFINPYNNSIPGCDTCPDEFFCDSYLRCLVQTMPIYIQPIGTCRMGSIDDNNAVVDERLRVKGVNGLRVIDSSVIPIGCEQLYALTVMIGERGAQFIKDDNSFENSSSFKLDFNYTPLTLIFLKIIQFILI